MLLVGESVDMLMFDRLPVANLGSDGKGGTVTLTFGLMDTQCGNVQACGSENTALRHPVIH